MPSSNQALKSFENYRHFSILGRRYLRGFFQNNKVRSDLGLRALLPEWKKFFNAGNLKSDILAGITVGCVAIPLSLAIALASGVTPALGLTTSIVAGVVCALFGGTPLAVSGPAAAMSVLIASVVSAHGLTGLIIIGAGTGVLQLFSGVFGFGKFVRLIPLPVVEGFTAGIGAIILLGQLPKALGLADGAWYAINPTIATVSLITFAIVKLAPKFVPAIPGPLLGVLLPTIGVVLLGVEVPSIGEIPRSLPLPKLPEIAGLEWGGIITMTFVVYFVASLETLLSSSVIDRMSKGPKHDPDQELIGQGLGNIAVSFMGGIPVTGVIARSALNFRSGAKTRLSPIIHSLTVLCAVFLLAPMLSIIPIAALAGVLIAVATSMLQPHTLLHLWKTSKGDGIVYAMTFVVLVAVDLIAGIQAGFIAAAVIGLLRASQLRFVVQRHLGGYPARISLSGAMTFLSTTRFEKIREIALKANAKHGITLDFSNVIQLDSSGAAFLVELVEDLKALKIPAVLKSMRVECRQTLERFDQKEVTSTLHATTEGDVEKLLAPTSLNSPRNRLLHGVKVFKREHRSRYEEIFRRLADNQSPHTLFITCSDSRIQPNLITATDPGELFVVRNVGNMIPPFGNDESPAEGAAIEYAVGILKVREIIVCGHYGCGAMASLFSGIDPTAYPSVVKWLEDAQKIREQFPHLKHPDQATEKNVLIQIEHLKTYPLVKQALENKELNVRAWIKDLKNAEILEWDERSRIFMPTDSLDTATLSEHGLNLSN